MQQDNDKEIKNCRKILRNEHPKLLEFMLQHKQIFSEFFF